MPQPWWQWGFAALEWFLKNKSPGGGEAAVWYATQVKTASMASAADVRALIRQCIQRLLDDGDPDMKNMLEGVDLRSAGLHEPPPAPPPADPASDGEDEDGEEGRQGAAGSKGAKPGATKRKRKKGSGGGKKNKSGKSEKTRDGPTKMEANSSGVVKGVHHALAMCPLYTR